MNPSSNELRWKLYETANGRLVVNDEIRDVLADRAARVTLGQLMTRLQFGRVLPRDTAVLGKGLLEARLTDHGNEYRLYFCHAEGVAVLLGLHFHRKGGQGRGRSSVPLRWHASVWSTGDGGAYDESYIGGD